MTRHTIFAIRDVVANQLTPLFVLPNWEAGKRQFRQFLTQGDGLNPDEYELISLGILQTDTEDNRPLSAHITAPESDFPVVVISGTRVMEAAK